MIHDDDRMEMIRRVSNEINISFAVSALHVALYSGTCSWCKGEVVADGVSIGRVDPVGRHWELIACRGGFGSCRLDDFGDFHVAVARSIHVDGIRIPCSRTPVKDSWCFTGTNGC